MTSKGDKINDRYQIIKTIGEGGMANVYLALDTILNREVAVKILRGDLADDEKFVRRFQREALSASKLNHPNIVEMYDVGEDDGKYYIVMEYINGKTLKNLIKKRGGLTLHEVIDIMTQLTSAIMCAHDSYIIHRDIKPQNVLILDDGRVKITDFGIAMALNNHELTQTNSVMGSVHYLPPEQATGVGSTTKSDIYSLGILMYELLIGKVPFKGDNAVEIAIKQMKEPIPSVKEQKPEIPQSLENIILKACEKKPKNRYESAKDMYEDIINSLNEENLNQEKITYKYKEQELEEEKVVPIKVEKKKGVHMKKKPSKKDKILWITGGIFAFLVAVICLFLIIFPKLTEVKEVTIPDVANLTVVEAETILKNAGLTVATEVSERDSDTIEAGKVVGTNPLVGRTVKQDTEITIVVAKESGKIPVTDYKGMDYKTVEYNFKNAGVNVILEPKKIEKKDQGKYKENTIVEQSVKEGSKLEKGDTIVLYYAVFEIVYPDFTNGDYSLGDVTSFCNQYNINLKVIYETSNLYEDGTILRQNRTGEVIKGQTLTITVSKVESIDE